MAASYDAAISYDKGCYAGQEVVARIRTYGHVNKLLRRIRLDGDHVPCAGDPVILEEREIGTITSASRSPTTGNGVALAYVRHKVASVGTRVTVTSREGSLGGVIEPLGVTGAPQ